jgi:hypothetical protein
LRLQIDRLQTKQLSGESIKIEELTSALTELETLVRRDAPGVDNETAHAAAEFDAALDRLIAGRQHDENDELERLRADNAELRAENERLQSLRPAPPEPTSSPEPPANVVPIDPNNRRPPAHYLKDDQPREPCWDGSGVLAAPWTPPGGLEAIARGGGWR